MSAPASTVAVDERLALLDGLIYADGFNCAVTFDELWRYSTAVVSREELRRRLREDFVLRELIAERYGLYSLAERSELLAERPARIERARRLRRRARRVARVLRHVPFVRGLLLTGSAAAANARANADIDVLVIVAPGRLATVFLVFGSASRLLRRRLFCPNYYLSEDRLTIEPPSLYTAREIAQAAGLVGDTAALRDANQWLGELLPNAIVGAEPDDGIASGARVQRLLERPLRGALGDLLERGARRLATKRLRAHHRAFGEEVPVHASDGLAAGVTLSFHRGQRHEKAVERHAALRARLARELERLEREHEARTGGAPRPGRPVDICNSNRPPG